MQQGKVNYFIGNEPKKWRTNIPTYTSVRYKEIYKGIDIKFYGNNNQMEYDIIVKPGGDPNSVQLAYEGIEGLKVTQEGSLEIALKACPEQERGNCKIIQKKPIIYQEINGERVAVDGRFKIQDAGFKFQDKSLNPDLQLGTCNLQPCSYTFEVASYNKNHALVIDPVLVWSTYLGGSSLDFGIGIAVDGSGNVYITGVTWSTDFPTDSPIQGSLLGYANTFITKINSSGSAIIYSTYLGGNSWDYSRGIAVDTLGNVYITGQTYSIDFPTISPIQGNNAGYYDAFVTKINSAGNNIVYSTYLGGSGNDYGSDIAVDASGNVYITGPTSSTNFPTASPIQGNNAGYDDVFVTKINSSGSAIVYSTYLGGSGWELSMWHFNSIAVDTLGNAYITGETDSTDFPTVSPIQTSNAGGGGDIFVTKINPSGSAIVYSTYLGGSNYESGLGIAVDALGNAYITGETDSTDFPTVSPIHGTYAGRYDAFVTKINSSGSAIIYSTYIGGSDWDYGSNIVVDTSGNAYITGTTQSIDFPTASPLQGSNAGWRDAFITKINPTGSELVYSTYLGGSSDERWKSGDIAVDTSGNAYITGTTQSIDFPTVSPLQGTYVGGGDAFIVKIGEQVLPSTPADVINVVDTMLASGGIASTGVANAIISQLSNAQKNLATNPTSAVNMLNAVINFIQAQSGKKITTQSAETLIRYLTGIINSI